MNIRYSRRHGRKLKPNRAQRNRFRAAIEAKGRGHVRQISELASILAPVERPKTERRGPQHGRSDDAEKFRAKQRGGLIGNRKPAPTGGFTHAAKKRAERAARLATTLNQHAKAA